MNIHFKKVLGIIVMWCMSKLLYYISWPFMSYNKFKTLGLNVHFIRILN